MTHEEKKQAWAKCSRDFATPKVSARLLIEHDPSNPLFKGSADKLSIRQERVEESQSHKRVHGDGKKRKTVGDFPMSNAQMRDTKVKQSESNAQVALAEMCNRTRRVPENESVITAQFEPVLSTTMTGYSPSKGNSSCDLRPAPLNRLHARNRDGAVFHYEQIASVVRARAGEIQLQDLTGEDIVSALEASGDFELHYESDKENWSGYKFKAKKARGSNVRGGPTIQDGGSAASISDGDETSQATSGEDSVLGFSLDQFEWSS